MTTRFFIPTEVRWCDWQEVRALLPPWPQTVLIAATMSSLATATELKNSYLAGHEVKLLPVVSPDPSIASVQKITDEVMADVPDWIIAIGGGSVLDTAKAAAAITTNGGDVARHVRGTADTEQPGIPLIAIPTTSGSGSEVTPYASITDSHESRKISLSHDYLFPRFALLDPSLTLSLPPLQTAISGMDALSHSIEGYWSNRATPITDALAISAAKLLLDQLSNAQRNPQDLTARRLTMEGSMLAGLTISNARTTAVHAASYPMTVYYGIPHGLACALLLPPFIRFNSGAMAPQKERRLLDALGAVSMCDLADSVERLQAKLDLPAKLGEVGIGTNEISQIVANGFRPDRMANNPRQVTAEDFTMLLEAIL